ncbi:MAG: NADPH-dependent glutamate synthase [Alphaproteobacteria bacterium]|uniref:NADPH-dependent glutamate synthase n=1 Tax=Candidatus Nitrobium versatile TaxID=2884831 RepID=A0A953LY00_9BACT|nr:NADPH-dependent glutamate synthase [Candidatus Nitrobium versatile]
MAELTTQERMKIPRQPMPNQDGEVRRANFDEVALGYDEETAKKEAERCLQCKKPLCREGCPVGVLIPQFIKAMREGDMAGAVEAMKVKNNLPAICGRVCPQESQCEGKCILGKKGEPVAIGRLERFVGDYELAHRTCPLVSAPATGKKVAVVGTGPAGLTCAVDVAREGHKVTMFESLHGPGGVLIYGIPEFRLPKGVVHGEIDYAAKCLGIEILADHVIGRTITLDELLAEYDAVFLGTGAGLPSFMRIPGINLNGVMSANEFLTRVNLMKGYLFPQYDTPVKAGKSVAVVGAGNVAMDAARCSARIQALHAKKTGAEPGEVHIVYRRSRDEIPARAEEVHHAEEEGVIFDLLTNPVEILGDSEGKVVGMRCVRMELGEPDASGRRKPVTIPGSEFEMKVDTVIMALGTSPNPLVFVDADGLERTKHGTAVADTETGRTRKQRVWAGGDVVTGAATVISAMGAGKRAAADINAFLKGQSSW